MNPSDSLLNTSFPPYLPVVFVRLMIWRCQSQHCPLIRRDGTSGSVCILVCVLSTGLEVVVYSHSCLQGTEYYFASMVCCGVKVDFVVQCYSYAIMNSLHI